ncbi:MAG: phosphoglycerate dehydrogenase [Chloroflexi bacterium]|nr:phosphoglycerate dehydrogenase [Chloroflexota bacterium]
MILVADQIAEPGIDILREEAQVTVRTGLKPEQLLGIIGDYDALVVRSATKVTKAVFDAARKLQVVGRAGVGVDNIDLDEATRRGVVVVNSASASTFAVAEHTMALLLALARNVPQAMESLERGEWTPSKFMGLELRRKTLGLVGLGRIGTQVARRALGFEMRVIATDPFISREYAESNGVELVPLDRLLAEADFISLHAPLNPQNERMMGDDEFARMKEGAYLVNTARGGLVDEAALRHALDSGRLGGAALDVFATEPPAGCPLIDHPKVVLTPHISASSREAQVEAGTDVARLVLACLRGEHVSGAVNAPLRVSGDIEFIEPYLRLAETLGRALIQLAEARLETVEITYAGELAAHDVTPLTAAAIKGLLTPITEERVNLINARIIARSRGLNVVERKAERPEANYANLITLAVQAGDDRRVLAGTLLQDEPRIVRIDDYWVDVVPSGHVLVTHHTDRPGIIGRVGTLLGEGDVNISSMQVGRRVRRGEAIMIMNLDEPLSRELEQQVAAIPDIRSVKQISL